MKPLTLFIAFLYGLSVFFVFPLIFIRLNSYFFLSVYSFLVLKILGVILIMAGGGCWLYCAGLFHFLGKGTPVPTQPPKNLVIKGLYQYTRNPMYISVLVILLGYFFFFGHLMLLTYLFLLAGFFHLFITLYEEPTLKKKFGKDYKKYLKKTPRWF
ncbi:hypothetical protein COY13_04200 [Candidatus Roizmanbacteria bacterium CG_4_10_14_0_2_um_filter_36_35]|uniref:Isoprenylcysteine carboxylmethyltransferase family protein n=4 Tax=Candidatus Roizmaniibacteriota TaxID=1752723 RepID=A0A2M7BWB6_9BACT|nr:MAG: hypothetical protein COV86_02150 [Candidatus Roizmanbacteria bacterium CG11_big_fil_rev_8_21_14_0_20_35_14]PIV10872.1 MAG: hypothetical protein COS50_03095 [Candidatus Roizmanbacteria bacterium CG03_land_8_20_14_0_80_35_26]PIZ67040.1 MAG: hypothetical protein COY13_04200 [Candidatus Roizmanbacteria bacterium CG_4_10_14_0_2_um_filter_36_35]PJC33076.1 MAG: hypothetical protein CO049_01140 [Candidatus Roizmanbacteria bacterium CG_4_9_14_0_2_um_filter_36_12]